MKNFDTDRIALAQNITVVALQMADLDQTVARPGDDSTPADFGIHKKQEVLDAVLTLAKQIEGFANTYKDSLKKYFGVDSENLKTTYGKPLRDWRISQMK